MRGAGDRVPVDAILGEDARLQERLDQPQDAFVPDAFPHPRHEGGMRDLVEACGDVGLEHPVVLADRCAEVVNLRDRVLGSASWTETVGTRLEVRLEDRFEHQLQRGLHDSVGYGRDAQTALLAAAFRDHLLPHPGRGEPAVLEIISQPVEKRPATGRDGPRSDTIHTGRAATLVAPDPVPRHDEERRVIHEVAKVIELAARIMARPLVQFRLHRVYPRLRLRKARPRRAGIHQRPPRAAVMLRTRWTPSPCDRLSRPPWQDVTPATTTSPTPHPEGISRQRTFPPANRLLAGKGTFGAVPTFTLDRSSG